MFKALESLLNGALQTATSHSKLLNNHVIKKDSSSQIEKQDWLKKPDWVGSDGLREWVCGLKRGSAEWSVLTALLQFAVRHNRCFPSQTAIAVRAGVSRKTVNVVLRSLHERGIVRKVSRGYKTGCCYKSKKIKCNHLETRLYHVHQEFKNPEFRQQVNGILKIFTLPLFLIWGLTVVGIPESQWHKAKRLNLSSKVTRILCSSNLKRNSKTYIVSSTSGVAKKGPNGHAMKQFKQEISSSGIPGYIYTMKHRFNINKSAQVDLTAFPEEAIVYATAKINHFPHAKDPFELFVRSAQEWCKNNEVEADLEHAFKLRTRYNIPHNTHRILKPITQSYTVAGKKEETAYTRTPSIEKTLQEARRRQKNLERLRNQDPLKMAQDAQKCLESNNPFAKYAYQAIKNQLTQMSNLNDDHPEPTPTTTQPEPPESIAAKLKEYFKF